MWTKATIRVDGDSFQERFLNIIHYGDWLSFWCAILQTRIPVPLQILIDLKKH